MTTAAQMIAMTIFLFNFFSDPFSAASRLVDLLPAEEPVNDTFSGVIFCSVVRTDTRVTSKVGFDATIVSTALRTSALSGIFTETDFSLATGFSAAIFLAAAGLVRVFATPVFAACVFTEALTAGFALAFFAAALSAVFVEAFTSVFFTLVFAADFTLVFFADAFSAAFALAFFTADFSAAFFVTGFTVFSTDAFFAVFFAAAVCSVVFVFAISLSFAIKYIFL